MSPDERNLITNLFDRIRDAGSIDKDRQADTLIKDAVRQLPDAPYVLVQSVLLQENALAEAQARIDELEARVAELEQAQQPQTGRSGGFLGGSSALGSRASARGGSGSVPNVAAERAPAASVWGSSRPVDPEPMPQPGFRQPAMPPMPSMPQQPAPASGGGGFFRSAMAAAAGVAGGVLLSDSIKGMMGGGAASHHAGTEPRYQDPANNDPGLSQHAEAEPVDDTSWADSDDSMDA